MALQIILPKLGFSMEEGQLGSLLVRNGGEVTEGAPLFELRSDKSVQEVEAPSSGMLKIISELNQTYPIGSVLGEII